LSDECSYDLPCFPSQVAELEDRCCVVELELRNVQRQLQASKDECNALKEDLTEHLTQINSLKQSNFKLNRDLEDSSDQIQQLKIKYAFHCFNDLFCFKVLINVGEKRKN
jgi:septal ring factor EnvC (AmiA/AmiB activator)